MKNPSPRVDNFDLITEMKSVTKSVKNGHVGNKVINNNNIDSKGLTGLTLLLKGSQKVTYFVTKINSVIRSKFPTRGGYLLNFDLVGIGETHE